MNKIRLILGIVCLLIAVALVVLNLTLTPGSMWFDLGYGNMPWVPPIVFGIIGIILVITAMFKGEEEPQAQTVPAPQNPEKAALNKRLETIGWGCFLIMCAGFILVPKVWRSIPDGLWSIGVGLIMLGLNAARYAYKIKMSGFTSVLGIISIIGGVIQLFGVKGLEGAFLLLILGAYLILKPWFEKQRLFGKAETD